VIVALKSLIRMLWALAAKENSRASMVRKFLMSSYNTAHEEKYFVERFCSQPGSYRCMKKLITLWAAALVVLKRKKNNSDDEDER
jgi:hypothetical protein